MKSRKYLLYLSYMGTKYRGMQKQTPPDVPDPTTVCGWLEIALRKVARPNAPTIIVASRTDQGVHALRTAVHCNLELHFGPALLVQRLNKFFTNHEHDIYVQEGRIVPDEFDARRSAKMRSYLYRLAVRKDKVDSGAQTDVCGVIPHCLPIVELNRSCFVMNPEFNVDAAQAALKRISGTNDFRGFVSRPSTNLKDDIRTVRTLTDVHLLPDVPYLPGHPYANLFNFWNITCSSNAFLYHQIRRIVGIVLAIAQGRVTLDELELLFMKPSFDNWPKLAHLAPACGLYKTNIVYDEADLVCPDTDDDDDDFIRSLHVSSVPELMQQLRDFKGTVNEKINLKQKLLDSLNKQKKT